MQSLDGFAAELAFAILRVKRAIRIAIFTVKLLLTRPGPSILAQIGGAAFPTGDGNHTWASAWVTVLRGQSIPYLSVTIGPLPKKIQVTVSTAVPVSTNYVYAALTRHQQSLMFIMECHIFLYGWLKVSLARRLYKLLNQIIAASVK